LIFREDNYSDWIIEESDYPCYSMRAGADQGFFWWGGGKRVDRIKKFRGVK
jgi:hypothetical protein